MPRAHILRLTVIATLLLVRGGDAWGQLPLCAEAKPEATFLLYRSCGGAGAVGVNRFLQELSVDHAFKSPDLPFERSILGAVSIGYDGKRLGEDRVVSYLRGLPPIQFTRLDVSTGSFEMVPEAAARTATLDSTAATDPFTISVMWPERVRGGYWRTPATLHLALWERARPTIRLASKLGATHDAEISCIAITTSAIRIETAGESKPDILVLFDQCL